MTCYSMIDLLINIDVLLMVQRVIRDETCHAIHRYAKTNNKYMKDYEKIKEPFYLKNWNVNNLYG